MRLLVFVLSFLAIQSAIVFAQSAATLIADRISYNANTGQLTASGNIKIFFEDRILSASAITYNDKTDKISIPQPFTISEGNTIIRGSSADIDGRLEEALILGAEALIEDTLSLNAERIERNASGELRFQTVIASTCQTCGARPTPFWRIRSSEVTYREDAERVFFKDARFELFGVPVLGFPSFSAPQPGVTRSSGFLAPQLISNTTLGIGAKVPYYRVIDDHSDATITPFITSKGGLVIEGEYRRLTKNGGYQVNGALGFGDSLTGHSISGFIQSEGMFYLPRNYILEFRANVSTDFDPATERGFMEIYDYTDDDRLNNELKLSRTKSDSYFEVSTSFTQSFRLSDTSSDVPVVFPNAYFREKYSNSIFGGDLEYSLFVTALDLGNDQNYARIGGTIAWQNTTITRQGIVLTSDIQLVGNGYFGAGTNSFVATPITAVEIKYPLSYSSAAATHVLEPIVQLVWSPDTPWGTAIENPSANDSTTAEFEETNLFSLNRFPGFDAVEAGFRANLGLRYLRYAPNGWVLGVTVGRVFRSRDLGQFATTTANGLENKNSDYVATVQLSLPDRLNVVNRLLFDPDFNVSKNELELSYTAEKFKSAVRYIYLDDILGSAALQHELSVLAQYQLESDWALLIDWRENLVSNQTIDGKIGLIYENECAKLQFSFSISYDSNGNRESAFGVQLSLLGLGGNNTKQASHRCGG